MKRRILVVDDEAIVAHDIAECLTHMGCEVVGTALSGPDAIAKAGSLRPDLIMMDIVLQGPMDGVEAATVIRQRHDVPCVFLTAYSDGAVLARAKAAAPAGYMVKPFEEAGLRSTVEIALYKVDLERALRESREWFLLVLDALSVENTHRPGHELPGQMRSLGLLNLVRISHALKRLRLSHQRQTAQCFDNQPRAQRRQPVMQTCRCILGLNREGATQ